MKRSRVNRAIETAKTVLATLGMNLPPFAFLDPMERFPVMEEDEARRHYLCNEYPIPIHH